MQDFSTSGQQRQPNIENNTTKRFDFFPNSHVSFDQNSHRFSGTHSPDYKMKWTETSDP